jgi:hypothetical protein
MFLFLNLWLLCVVIYLTDFFPLAKTQRSLRKLYFTCCLIFFAVFASLAREEKQEPNYERCFTYFHHPSLHLLSQWNCPLSTLFNSLSKHFQFCFLPFIHSLALNAFTIHPCNIQTFVVIHH